MRALLDVNVWVALFDDNGVIRVMNLPGYGRRGAVGLTAVRDRLRLVCNTLDHEFWPDDVSLRDEARVDFNRIHGHNQVTDVYLVALAVHHGGCLLTFDRGIALSAVHGARPEHLEIL